MVAAFLQKALKVWYWFVLAYGLHIIAKADYFSKAMSDLPVSAFYIRFGIELSVAMFLQLIWKVPFSWITTFFLTAIPFHLWNIMSPTHYVLPILFLSFYYQYQSAATYKESQTANRIP